MVGEQECVGHEMGSAEYHFAGNTSVGSITEVSLGIHLWPDGQVRENIWVEVENESSQR